MNTNNLNMNLVIGMAAFGLGLVVTGVRLYRNKQASGAAGAREDDLVSDANTSGEESLLGENPPQARKVLRSLPSNPSPENQPLQFFLLVFVITIPFWIFGGKQLPVPMKLPVSALAAFNPLIAALLLTYRRDKFTGIKELFKKVLDTSKIKHKIWYLPSLFLFPLISGLSYAVMRLAGLPLPDPDIPWSMVPVYFLVFFIFGIGEELGWMGYAFDPLQDRWGALKASILLGLVWATYHLIPDLQNQQAAGWIFWHRLNTVIFRILIVWVYNNAGKSVFTAILFHVTNNLSWALFPNNGSHYNPFITFMLTLPVVIFVILGWDPKTFVRYRHARASQPKAL